MITQKKRKTLFMHVMYTLYKCRTVDHNKKVEYYLNNNYYNNNKNNNNNDNKCARVIFI